LSNRERVLVLVVLFVQFRYLIVRVYNPFCGVGAWCGCEGSDEPLLNLACSDAVRSAAAVLTVVVDVQVESDRGCLPDVCDIRNYNERLVESQVGRGYGYAWS
jgi:hypothetical protein